MAFRYEKQSDSNYAYCFLDVFRDQDEFPFMDVRISNEGKVGFCIYESSKDMVISQEEWLELYNKSVSFYAKEVEIEKAFHDLTKVDSGNKA